MHLQPPLQQVGHAPRGPAAVRLLLPPEHRDRGFALLLRHEFGHEVGELELERQFVIVDGLMFAQEFLDALDAREQVRILEVRQPAGRGHHRAHGLHGQLEAGGDVGDLDQLDRVVHVVVGQDHHGVTQRPIRVFAELALDVFVPRGEARAAPHGRRGAVAGLAGILGHGGDEVLEHFLAGLAELLRQGGALDHVHAGAVAGEAGFFPHPVMRPVVEILRGGLDGFGTEGLHLRFIRGCGRDLDAFGLVLERRLLGVGGQRDPCDRHQRGEEAGECFHGVETMERRRWRPVPSSIAIAAPLR